MTRVRAFRLHGYVHRWLIPGLVLISPVVAVPGWVIFASAQQRGLDLRWILFCLLCAGSFAAFLGFIFKALVAYGLVPLVVVWRRGDKVWVGPPLAVLGLDRRRIVLDRSDIQVGLVRIHNAHDGLPMVFDVQVASAGIGIMLRSRGAVDAQALQEFLVANAVRLGPAAPDAGGERG